MTLFQTLAPFLSKDVSFSIAISKDEEQLTVTIVPVGKQKYPPLNFTGMAAEIDDEFIDEIEKQFQEAGGILSVTVGNFSAEEKKKDEKKSEPAKTTQPVKEKPKTAAEIKKENAEKSKKSVTELAKKQTTQAVTTEPATTTLPVGDVLIVKPQPLSFPKVEENAERKADAIEDVDNSLDRPTIPQEQPESTDQEKAAFVKPAAKDLFDFD